MDRKEAIRAMGEYLADMGVVKLVENKPLQAYLVSNFPAAPLDEEHTTTSTDDFGSGFNLKDRLDRLKTEGRNTVFIKFNYDKAVKGANYVLLDSKYVVHKYYDDYEIERNLLLLEISYVPFAIVSDDDVENIKLHYGGVGYPDRLKQAANKLGIELGVDYVELYMAEPDGFKKYFSNIRDDQDREDVLKLVMESGVHNDLLEEWLTERFGVVTKKVLRDTIKDD